MSEVLEIIEVDVVYCALRYGETNAFGTCPAVLGVDSVIKCFNTTKTCPVRASFVNVPVTLRFSREDVDYHPKDIDAIPSLMSVDYMSGTIDPGRSLGERSSLSASFRDHPYGDAGQGFDKYRTERDYYPNANDRGTFWGKFRARFHMMIGAAVRWRVGVVGQMLDEMETRHFVLDSYEGPRPDGSFTLMAKDALKLADGDRAQAPMLNTGFLSAAIDDNDVSITLLPSGVGNEEYASSGWIAIGGNEICSFTRVADVMTIVRAQFNTEAQAHDIRDRVQQCLRFNAATVASVIRTLLVDYAGVPTEYVPIADWELEVDQFLGTLYTTLIAEPTDVKTLLDELIEQAALMLWWDDVNREVRLVVLHGVVQNRLFSLDNILEGTLQTSDNPELRISQVWTWYSMINPLEDLNEKNFRSVVLNVDLQSEDDYGSAAVRKIMSRWIPAGGAAVASRLNEVVLGRYSNPPRTFQFSAQRFLGTSPGLGDGSLLAAHFLQDDTGAAAEVPVQFVRLMPGKDSLACEAQEVLWVAPATDLATRPIIFDADINNVNLRTTHDSFYPEPQSGDVVTCTVQADVIIGSATAAGRAFDVGSWPAGVDISVEVLGRIQGAGGTGGGKSSGAGTPGTVGGPALYTRYPIDLLSTTGEIWGGGGGGGGGDDGGGGGGAGQVPGPIGAHVNPGSPGTTEAGGAGTADGGAGGGPGLAGANSDAAGGAAGAAIDGDSFVTDVGGVGDIRGGQIN